VIKTKVWMVVQVTEWAVPTVHGPFKSEKEAKKWLKKNIEKINKDGGFNLKNVYYYRILKYD